MAVNIKSIRIESLLSFGQPAMELPLQDLNILIGPNGSGKSNLLEVIDLLRNTNRDFRKVIAEGGGIENWIWKGQPDAVGQVSIEIDNPTLGFSRPITHGLAFRAVNQRSELVDEFIENTTPNPGEKDVYFYYRFQNGYPVVNTTVEKGRELKRETVDLNASIIAQRKDPEIYPEITYLGQFYDQVRIYRNWSFGRNSVFRQPQQADQRDDFLEEDFSNLGMILSRIRSQPKVKRRFIEYLQDLYEGLTGYEVIVKGGSVQIIFDEGDYSIPATRLSDGSMRYLSLLAILLDPEPPALLCIEEPELGLHPDAISSIADLLKEAAQRTQLLVTTHSEIIVDACSDEPQSIVTCEKQDGKTIMKRLDGNRLAEWLQDYSLGTLWSKGEIGANRW